MNSEDIKKLTIDEVQAYMRTGGLHSPEYMLGEMELRRRELVYQRRSVVVVAIISGLAAIGSGIIAALITLSGRCSPG